MRAAEEDKLLPAAAAALEARPSSASLSFRDLRPKRMSKFPQDPQPASFPADDQPEQIMNRVAGLTQVFLDAGVMKPTGQISEGIFSEWKTGVARLSQDKVTHADKATIINAVRTCAELKHFMAARDREMPPELDLREGPVRAFNSWRWLSRQGQLNWPLEGI